MAPGRCRRRQLSRFLACWHVALVPAVKVSVVGYGGGIGAMVCWLTRIRRATRQLRASAAPSQHHRTVIRDHHRDAQQPPACSRESGGRCHPVLL